MSAPEPLGVERVDPFDAVMARVARSDLPEADKRAIIISVCYVRVCALAAVLRNDVGGESRMIREAQRTLGEAARAFQAVQP